MRAYCLGLSDQAGCSELHLSELKPGGSCHSLGESVDFRHQPMKPAYSQGSGAARLDDLVTAGTVPLPTHIKIDIDGFEPKVIAGARRVLADRGVRSPLIETNPGLPELAQQTAAAATPPVSNFTF